MTDTLLVQANQVRLKDKWQETPKNEYEERIKNIHTRREIDRHVNTTLSDKERMRHRYEIDRSVRSTA